MDDEDIDDENTFRPIAVITYIVKRDRHSSVMKFSILLYNTALLHWINLESYLERHLSQINLHRVTDDWFENVYDR